MMSRGCKRCVRRLACVRVLGERKLSEFKERVVDDVYTSWESQDGLAIELRIGL
jgi:hypothetical protein